MSRYIQTAVLSVILIVFGLWGYLGSDTASLTALIPVVVGVLILGTVPFIKNNNKIAGIICLVLTVLIVVGLIKPIMGAWGRDDMPALARVSFMFVFSLYTIVATFFCPRCK